MKPDARKDYMTVTALFAASFAIHLLCMFYFSNAPYFEGISGYFISTAENMLEGKGFVEKIFDGSDYFYQPAIWAPPVYSTLLYMSFLIFGKSIFVFKIIQIALLSFVAPAMYLFSKKMLGRRYGLLVAMITILYLPNLRISSTVLSEVLLGPLLLASAMLFLNKKYFWAGIVFGIASLTRDYGLIFTPAFIAYLFLAKQKKPVTNAITFLLAFFLVISPWMLHNYNHYGHFAISAPKIGCGVLQGLWEYDREGRFETAWSDENLVKSENASSYLYPDPFSRDEKRLQKAMAIIEKEPVWYVGITMRRLPQFLFMNIDGRITSKFKEALLYNADITQLPQLVKALIFEKYGLVTLIMWIEQIIIYLFAIIGARLIIKTRKKELYLFVLIILNIFVLLVSHLEPRYFSPVNYFVIFLAAYGIAKTNFIKMHEAIQMFRKKASFSDKTYFGRKNTETDKKGKT